MIQWMSEWMNLMNCAKKTIGNNKEMVKWLKERLTELMNFSKCKMERNGWMHEWMNEFNELL